MYDPYGDPLSVTFVDPPACTTPTTVQANIQVQFHDGVATWTEDIDDLDGAEFVQVRVTFVSNAATGLSPVLDTLALPFRF